MFLVMTSTLRIKEVFHSIQGESRFVGIPTVFIRLTGCPLRCGYCDSEYAFHGGERVTVDSLLAQVEQTGCRYVCVTGGEPLAQPEVFRLMSALCDADLSVSLETSGALPVDDVDPRVSIVMDLKTPGSGEVGKNLYRNIQKLGKKDDVKFVITGKGDYDWARFKSDEYSLADVVGNVLFSPCSGFDIERSLAEWIIQDGLGVRFQLQLHRVLWGDVPGV